jgi:hypothetical protein
MANPGEKYLINDIAVKAALIADLVNENSQMEAELNRVSEVLTTKQREKLDLR